MREIWLSPNRRAIWFGCVPPLVMASLGAWLTFGTSESATGLWSKVGIGLLVFGVGLAALLACLLRRPRIAYHEGEVLFYLRSGPPIAVPAHIVEAFFMGRGPVELPGLRVRDETVNLVARLSQRHADWARREVKPALGKWDESYVTIRGTWCEPLNTSLVRRLNHRLHEVKLQNVHAPKLAQPQSAT